MYIYTFQNTPPLVFINQRTCLTGQYECFIMLHQHIKMIIRYICCGSRSTFLFANRGFPSTCTSTYYFLGCNCYLIVLAILVIRNLQTILTFGQNLFEYVLEFIRDVSKTQIGEEYGPWVPFIGTLFLFIFVSNWSGAFLPWKIIQLPYGELAAPTNDINTTVALALLTLVAYFYAGLSKKRISLF